MATITIQPTLNDDGTYTMKVTSYELSEIIKGIKYMDRQRANARKSKNSQSQHICSLNIIHPNTQLYPAQQTMTLKPIY